MNSILKCIDRNHKSCAHATIRKLLRFVETVETSIQDDEGTKAAVVGIRADHWKQFVLENDNPERHLDMRTFSLTRRDGGIVFVVPFEELPNPKKLNNEEQQRLIDAILLEREQAKFSI